MTYPQMPGWGGNLMAAIDCETSGLDPNYHEVIQIAIVPLDTEFEPLAEVKPFYTVVRPEYPERWCPKAAAAHKLDLDQLLMTAPERGRVEDDLYDWFQRLGFTGSQRLLPLAANWPFDKSFLNAWLGQKLVDELFHAHYRDPMELAVLMNDRACFMGEALPFNRANMKYLCEATGIENPNPHNALCDSITEGKVYREMMRLWG